MCEDQYQITCHGSQEKGYYGVYALPGDPHWRSVNDAEGTPIRRDDRYEAVAEAGHRLVSELNRRLRHSQSLGSEAA